MKQMRTKEFDKIKPYTYLIVRKSDNKKYHGVRCGNKLPPIEDFGKEYFGSSTTTITNEFKKNRDKFIYRLAWTFDSVDEARIYEVKVNKKIIKRPDWANISAWPLINMSKEMRKKISNALTGKRIGRKNYFYGKKHTQESKDKVSKANKGRKLTSYQKEKIIQSNRTRVYGPETLKKISKINKGRKFGKEVREKIAKSRIGMKLSEEHKKSIGLGVKGEKNGMFGKTHSAEVRKKLSMYRLGKPIPLSTREKISESLKGKFVGEKNPMYGRFHSELTKNKISQKNKGMIPWNQGLKTGEETKKKISETLKKNMTLERRNKISLGLKGKFVGEKNPMFGKPAWNRGQSRSEETKKKISQSKKGSIPWNKGKKGLQVAWNKDLKVKDYNKEMHL